jgi:ring-1,2-phenylacetyl-CoA epoxidase subunit PaaD
MVTTRRDAAGRRAWAVAETVTDPELPVLTLADLGVLREVAAGEDGTVTVSITPTYSGCPALHTMRDDLVHALRDAGYQRVEVRVVLHPAWTTDRMSDAGRRKLAAAGIAPPGAVPARRAGPVPLTLTAPPRRVHCPRCGSAETERLSDFSGTACKCLRRCLACREPFEHFKEL